MKILVADDDPVSCRLMQRMLERDGYEVVVAADGRAAVSALTSSDGPKLALIDWMMPELDGPGVCAEVRCRPDGSYVYILLLTSKQSQEDIVEGLEAGADDYLTKPCNPAEVKARLMTGRRILELEQKLVEAREGMRFRATHDGLTQLMNRTAILTHLHQALERSTRNGLPCAVLLCDIDHFKRINDVHGHVAGDTVLENFAKRLQRAVRAGDAIGRYGGEEFLIVLEGCSTEDVATRAEQVRRLVTDTPFRVRESVLKVSASIGGISINGSHRPITPEQMIDLADAAMYQAKAGGRDCIRIAA